jgi:2-C-methyl-D-erythritol 4-phosphate cytidylyltransferase
MAGILARLKQRKQDAHPFCTAIVPAAGSAVRMEGRDKVMEPLAGIPVLARTLQALDACPLIDEIVVVTREDLIVPVGQLCQDYEIKKASKVVRGGASRTESVCFGLREISPKAELVAVHDGARPLVSREVLEAVLARGASTGAAAPAIPVKDTIKRAQYHLVTETPDRSELFAVQTPQVFEPVLLSGALKRALEDGWNVTDDCSAVEQLGMSVTLTQGSEENIKLTTPIDFALAEAILAWREQT